MATCECCRTSQRLPASSTQAYFDSWRRMRRAAHESLTKSAVRRYHPIQTKEATILASALLSNPEYRNEHFRRASTSTIMSILYDYPTLVSVHDKAVEDIGRNVRLSTRASSYGLFLVEFLPWMIHIPERFRFSPQPQDCNLHLMD